MIQFSKDQEREKKRFITNVERSLERWSFSCDVKELHKRFVSVFCNQRCGNLAHLHNPHMNPALKC